LSDATLKKQGVKKLYIETFGCAMNVRDSEHLVAELSSKESYITTHMPEEADLILINTCSVREKPVHKLFSEIGRFAKIKQRNAKIGVCGCTASHMGEEILRKAPIVNFVLGARNVSKIAEIIHKDGAVEVSMDYDESTYPFASSHETSLKTLVNISIGCDKKCTFCIVPHTRGEEISIPSQMIINEVMRAVDHGAKEVLLLGQNVNHYGRRFTGEHEKMGFVELLDRVSEIKGLERIRFTSPHPLHMDDLFLEFFAHNPKICKSIHMPLQSGSTRVLRRMRRGYDKAWFLDRAAKIRTLVPSVTIGTDVIVGFPGESDDDFEETLNVVQTVGFEQMFSFKYSPRPHTEAMHFEDCIDGDVASHRLARLQTLHREMLEIQAKKEIGAIHHVLFEHINEDGLLEGRSDNNRLIRVKNHRSQVGEILPVKVIESKGMVFLGELLET
jgi:tRNA-2-methylthio-N6-dimethylallyladenosine synthase